MGQAGGRARAGLSDPRQPATGKRPGLGCQAARGHVNCLLPLHSHLQPVRRGILYPRQWPLLAHGDLCYSLRTWGRTSEQFRLGSLGWDKPHLAQLARAPDCRLETLGCVQPSGGPRFKSGSADHNIIKLDNLSCNLYHTFAFCTTRERTIERSLPTFFDIF